MFSITITVVSMMMPKSIAPSEIRLAGVSLTFIRMNAPHSASGILIAAMIAALKFPRKKISTRKTSAIPMVRFSITVCSVVSTSEVRS